MEIQNSGSNYENAGKGSNPASSHRPFHDPAAVILNLVELKGVSAELLADSRLHDTINAFIGCQLNTRVLELTIDNGVLAGALRAVLRDAGDKLSPGVKTWAECALAAKDRYFSNR